MKLQNVQISGGFGDTIPRFRGFDPQIRFWPYLLAISEEQTLQPGYNIPHMLVDFSRKQKETKLDIRLELSH